MHAVVAGSTFPVKSAKKTDGYRALLDVQMCFRVAGARDCAPSICKDGFRVAGSVQKTCSSELLGGPGADFLRGVAFWSLRYSGLLR